MVEFAHRLKTCMDASTPRFTQTSLGKAAGLAQSSISKMLLGDSEPTISSAVAIASALGVSLEELIPGGPEPRPSERLQVDTAQVLPPAMNKRLTDIQRGMLGMAGRLLAQNRLTDRDCLLLMHDWMTRLEPLPEAGKTQ